MRFVGTALVAGTIGVLFLLAQGGWIRAGTEQSAEFKSSISRANRKELFRYSHIRDLTGMTVENVDGEKLGTVSDLVVELQSGRPEYVTIKSGGFFGGRRLTIVPMSAVAMKTAKVGIAAIDITRRQWKHAPGFSRNDLPLLNQAQKAREITRYYERGERAGRVHKIGDGWLMATGRGTPQTNNPAEHCVYRLAKDLVGSDLIARQNVKIGEITDLLVDLAEAKPAYAIASGDYLETGAQFAFPVTLLRTLPGRRLAIRAYRRDFEQAKPCRENDPQNSAGMGNNQIYRYER